MQNITLTPQESQLILEAFTQIAGMQQDYRKEAKIRIDNCWKLSEKETEQGRYAFKILNKSKDRIRQSKAYEAKINNLIRKIRKGL